MNFYVAWGESPHNTRIVMYSGFASSEERFVKLCEEAGFDLEGLEIELNKTNPKDEVGRLYKEGVRKDIGTI